jgi:signal transduction histidine kinase
MCVTVQDTGPGIAEPEALFEEVKRADSRKSPMGFRLVICRRIARLLGGDLTLESGSRRGARFTLWLPTVPASA